MPFNLAAPAAELHYKVCSSDFIQKKGTTRNLNENTHLNTTTSFLCKLVEFNIPQAIKLEETLTNLRS